MWASIGTWEFSLQAVEQAGQIMATGGSALDGAEAGVRLVESDPAVETVGRWGFLNAAGELELDAAIMDGDTLDMGVVACVKGFEHPVTIARRVMERTNHSILVGQGAEDFAREQGIPAADRERLISEHALQVWRENRPLGHDTIGCIALDEQGSLAVATSTSGASMKLPGRVGDSPIIGSGFYADSKIGAAAATGLGEDIMRTCCAYRVVALMEMGIPPMEAAEQVVRTAHQRIQAHGGKPDCIALVCMNAKGEYGAAANHKGFSYAIAQEGGEAKVIPVEPVL